MLLLHVKKKKKGKVSVKKKRVTFKYSTTGGRVGTRVWLTFMHRVKERADKAVKINE